LVVIDLTIDCLRRGKCVAEAASQGFFVMAGLDPAIHVFLAAGSAKTWMPGSPSAKTRFALLPGHDEVLGKPA
jgi:hypothetical protein